MSDGISVDQMEWVRRLAHVRRQKKALESQEKEVLAKVKAFLGERRSLTFDGAEVLHAGQVTQRRVDLTMLREVYPKVAEECTIPVTSVRITVADGVA